MRWEFAADELRFYESQAVVSVVHAWDPGVVQSGFVAEFGFFFLGEASVIFELVAHLVAGPLFISPIFNRPVSL